MLIPGSGLRRDPCLFQDKGRAKAEIQDLIHLERGKQGEPEAQAASIIQKRSMKAAKWNLMAASRNKRQRLVKARRGKGSTRYRSDCRKSITLYFLYFLHSLLR